MTVQQMVGASALVQAMRRDGQAAGGLADMTSRPRPMAARRTWPDERSEKPPQQPALQAVPAK